ncbi:MAG: GDP-mannose 4,6-dehydratase, partial [Ignavibacteriaceae bacterium]|nr:GDP-mannose 4,6-dehydratase [Ignavibacteriaceae bacterium]
MVRKKVVITGGAGFIGSHIAEYCLNEGAVVHIIDN